MPKIMMALEDSNLVAIIYTSDR